MKSWEVVCCLFHLAVYLNQGLYTCYMLFERWRCCLRPGGRRIGQTSLACWRPLVPNGTGCPFDEICGNGSQANKRRTHIEVILILIYMLVYSFIPQAAMWSNHIHINPLVFCDGQPVYNSIRPSLTCYCLLPYVILTILDTCSAPPPPQRRFPHHSRVVGEGGYDCKIVWKQAPCFK